MFEKFAALVLCALVLGGAGSIIWITYKGYDRRVKRSKTEVAPGLSAGPVRSRSRKRRKTPKRRARR